MVRASCAYPKLVSLSQQYKKVIDDFFWFYPPQEPERLRIALLMIIEKSIPLGH